MAAEGLVSLQVTGMTCGHCVRAVTEAVQGLDAKAEVTVDLASGQVDIRGGAAIADLVRVIEDEGYQARAL